VGRGGHAVHVLHLGGISEHGGRNLGGGEAVHLGAADAVVRGLCANRRDGEGTECCGNRRGWGLAWVLGLPSLGSAILALGTKSLASS